MHKARQKNSLKPYLYRQEGLLTPVLDRIDEGIFAWNEGTCTRTQTFVRLAVSLLGEVGRLDGLGNTLC